MSTTLAAALLATTVRLAVSHAYAEGAPPGFSGGFKEDSCHACHFHAEPNSGGGRVTIEGVPAKFAAGERYTLTVMLTRAGMKRGGFQLAARFKDGGAQAGTLAPGRSDAERVKVENPGGVQYAGQKLAGSSVARRSHTLDHRVDRTGPRRDGDLSCRGQRGGRQRKRGWRLRVHGERRIGAAAVIRRWWLGLTGRQRAAVEPEFLTEVPWPFRLSRPPHRSWLPIAPPSRPAHRGRSTRCSSPRRVSSSASSGTSRGTARSGATRSGRRRISPSISAVSSPG